MKKILDKVKVFFKFKSQEDLQTELCDVMEERIAFHYRKSAELFDEYKLQIDKEILSNEVYIDETKETYEKMIKELIIARDSIIIEVVKANDVLKARKEKVKNIKYENAESGM